MGRAFDTTYRRFDTLIYRYPNLIYRNLYIYLACMLPASGGGGEGEETTEQGGPQVGTTFRRIAPRCAAKRLRRSSRQTCETQRLAATPRGRAARRLSATSSSVRTRPNSRRVAASRPMPRVRLAWSSWRKSRRASSRASSSVARRL